MAAKKHVNFVGIHFGSNNHHVPNSVRTLLKLISVKLQEALKGRLPAIMLLESELCSVHPPTGYLGEA